MSTCPDDPSSAFEEAKWELEKEWQEQLEEEEAAAAAALKKRAELSFNARGVPKVRSQP